jgi:hypothetical protein
MSQNGWIGFDSPVMPMGICECEEEMDQSFGSFKALQSLYSTESNYCS